MISRATSTAYRALIATLIEAFITIFMVPLSLLTERLVQVLPVSRVIPVQASSWKGRACI